MEKQQDETVDKDGAGGGNTVMGRYMEQEITVEAASDALAASLVKTQDGLKIIYSAPAEDFLLKEGDGEAEPVSVSVYPESFQKLVKRREYFYSLAVAENGARIFSLFKKTNDGSNSYPKYLLLPDGTLQEWDEAADESVRANFWNGKDGYFYAELGKENYQIFRINVETGETEFLLESPDSISRVFSNGTYLFLNQKEKLTIFDLNSRTLLDEDPVLVGLAENELNKSTSSNSSGILIAAGDSPECIYVATEAGLYRHVLYGSIMEQVIDGSLCSIGDAGKYFTDMYADFTEGMPVFYFLYDNGGLYRFAFDETVSSVPDLTVRIYSLYEDHNIRLAIGEYRAVHPEIYLQYEIGVDEDLGKTKEDELKNLATRLAAGTGPDVFVLDGLPYSAYVEKGVLADLSGLTADMGQETFWDNIMDTFREENALYAIPAVFRLPVITGEEQSIQNLNTLSDLADLLEREEVREGMSLLGLLEPEKILYLMGLSSGSAFMKDGALDREAVIEFLTQCKRIYEADRKGLTEEQAEEKIEQLYGWSFGSENVELNYLINRPLCAEHQLSIGTAAHECPYTAGIFGGDIRYCLNEYLTWLDYTKKSCQVLPGVRPSAGKSCIVETLLGINEHSQVSKYAEDFVRFVMSEEFQEKALLTGIPMNRKAVYRQEENNVDEDGNVLAGIYSYSTVTLRNGEKLKIGVSWAADEQLARYHQLIESIDTVNICDARVFDEVIKEGVSVLEGAKGIEEAVNAIEKKVQLYLAE